MKIQPRLKRVLSTLAAIASLITSLGLIAQTAQAETATREAAPLDISGARFKGMMAPTVNLDAMAMETQVAAAAAPQGACSLTTEIGNDSWAKGLWRSDRDYTFDGRATLDCRDDDNRGSWQASFGQNMYTPRRDEREQPGTRSFGAMLYASVARTFSGESSAQAVQATAGVIGPAAMGEQVQNFWHRATGVPEQDWDSNQVNGAVLANAAYARADVIAASRPQAPVEYRLATVGEAGVGTITTYGRAGAVFEIGKNIPREIAPYTGNHTVSPRLALAGATRRGLGLSAFVGAGMRAVASDWTLDRSRLNPETETFVPELGGGMRGQFGRINGAVTLTHSGKTYEAQRKDEQRVSFRMGYRF